MSLSSRAHGANPEKLYAAMGVPMPEKVIDFSTNTNVLPWCGDLSIDLSRCLTSYPDDEATELRLLIAGQNGCAPENVLVLNGSNEGVYLIASFLAGKRAAVLQPAYGEYLRALSAYGAETRNVSSPEDPKDDAEALFLCNPCNPTGTYIESAELEGLFIRRPRTLFVVDEAYVDFLTGEDRRLDFLSHDNVVVLRSLTKIYHLCGARIGYLLADRERVVRLKSRQPTWSVNAVAQAAARAYMRDGDFVRRTRAFYAAETPRFMRGIEKAGFRAWPTRTNFFLVEAGDDRRLIRELLERGLVVRHTRNFPGLDGRCVRVATRLPEENDMLVDALSGLSR